MAGDRAGGEGAAAAQAARFDSPYQYLLDVARWVLVVVGILPWVLPYARAYLPIGAAGEVLDRLFWPMCHRFPERTLVLAGWLMPLCSRCAGIFAGLALGAVVAWPRLSLRAWRPVLIGAAAIMVVEVLTQDLGLHPVFHPTRVATGILLGYAMAAAFITATTSRSATALRSAATSRPR
jgi:uncharacterized membrane protein